MKLVKHMLMKNPCYQKGQKMKVKGLMLHSVGCAQPKASVFLKLWNQEHYDRACVHAFIDGNDGTVYQSLPWDYRGWHCGGSANNTHIGVEMCEPASIRYVNGSQVTCLDVDKARKTARTTYESAVELFAHLCGEYYLDPMAEGVIISHAEGHKRGIASNHGDPEHLWNGLGMDYTMNGFRKEVKCAMEKTDKEENGEAELSDGSYLVKVEIPNLNIRKGPGTDYEKTGRYTGEGVFTIVQEADGQGADRWGRLKSGAGWIALDYTKRVA